MQLCTLKCEQKETTKKMGTKVKINFYLLIIGNIVWSCGWQFSSKDNHVEILRDGDSEFLE